MLDETLVARVAELDKVIILHNDFEDAVLGIEQCVLKSKYYLEPVGSLLLAKTGMGKTTLSRALLARMPASTLQEENVEKTIVPAFYFEIPSPARVGSVAASMINALGASASSSTTSPAALTDRLCILLRNSKTTLVFADEVHNLFEDKDQTTKVCTWIKTLVNQTKIAFCLVGEPEFEPALTNHRELSRRFRKKFHMKPLGAGDQSLPGDIVPFVDEALKRAKQRLDLASIPRFDSLYSATQLYAATGGIPSYVMSLIKEAALEALCAGTSHVTLENFAEAWESGGYESASIVADNPFRLSHGALATAIKRGP